MRKNSDTNSGSRRPFRLWWFGPSFRNLSDAEYKAQVLMLALFFVGGVASTFIAGLIFDRILGPQHDVADVISMIIFPIASIYFASDICRWLFPDLMRQAEANYVRYMQSRRQ